MPKTTEQKFKLHANFWFEITIQDLKDLFCTMGQGSYYWCNDMEVGYFERDLDGTYVGSDKYEHQGCCAWLVDIDLDTPIYLEDSEGDNHEFKVSDVIKAIENIVSGKTNLNTEDCATIFEAFKDDNLGLIDASIADSILQITTYNTLVYGQ